MGSLSQRGPIFPRDDEASSSGAGEDGVPFDAVRKVRIHKIKRQNISEAISNSSARQDAAALDRKVAELIPGIADLGLSSAGPSTQRPASAFVSRQKALEQELQEMADIYDLDRPNPVDVPEPAQASTWKQTMRPTPKRIVLSQYQVEMINYQRMLLRKNIWYYRDRMNNARGPCALHVLKEAWVQGVIDENTLVWGQGLYDWLPAKNVKLLLPMVRTPEVRFGAWLKRTFSLKPALNRIREARKDERDPAHLSKQVDLMR